MFSDRNRSFGNRDLLTPDYPRNKLAITDAIVPRSVMMQKVPIQEAGSRPLLRTASCWTTKSDLE